MINPFSGSGWLHDHSGIFGQIGNIFGGMDQRNPYDEGMKYLDKIPGTMKPYYDPYINAGHSALDSLMGQYGNLMGNPGAMMGKMGGGFQQSPGYQFQVNQAQNAANNAAAAGGMLGTPMHQQNSAQMVNNLANQDYYNYLDHSLGLYGMGLNGMGNINQMGYGASNELAQSLANYLQSQAQFGAQSANWNNQRKQGLWGSIGGAIGSLF